MRDVRQVLVVEDDEHLLELVLGWLQAMGIAGHAATSVKEAADALVSRAVDLVLSDYLLPDGTGQDVLNLVMECRPIPLMIVMSGMASARDAFALGQAGVAEYLEKPFLIDNLRQAIEDAKSYSVPTSFSLMAASCVGNMSVRKLYGDLRDVMTDQAMALAKGNRTRAAMFLRIQRQSLSAR